MNPNELKPVTDQEQIAAMGRQIADLLSQAYDGRELLLKKDNWVAVPCAGRIDDCLGNRINLVTQEPNHLIAYSLLRQTHIPNMFQVPPTSDGINALDDNFGMINFLLSPDDLSWFAIVISEEPDDICIFVGTVAVVETILGTDLNAAYASFEEFVPQSSWSDTVAYRQSLFQQLKFTYAKAVEGTFVRFPEKVVWEILWPASFNRFIPKS